MTVPELIKAVLRIAAFRIYEAWQGWRNFKADAAELWQYQRFRFEQWFSQIWPFRSPAWLLSLRVPRDQVGFGKFGEKEEVMYLPDDHPIFDLKNDHLFTAEAASKAFSHVELPGQEDAEISKQREERLANIVIWGIALSMLIAFTAAVAAILFMK